MRRLTYTLIAAVLAMPVWAWAGNVDLVTLPARDSVQLTIYNSEDLTLVKETRYLTLKKGLNKLQFSWANTLIDPTSVTFRPLDHTDEVELADTIFPGQKPQHLIWNIDSKFEGQVKVEVSYFTSGLSWSMDYVAISDPGETTLNFRGYVRVYNNSGEEYDNAQVRLIVGTINLVEKIADLARRRGITLEELKRDKDRLGEVRKEVVADGMMKADLAKCEAMPCVAAAAPKAIVKEGLSEYFMFSVAGSETIPNGWSKRMQAVEARETPFDIVYRMRDFQYGPQPVRMFIWRNDDEHKLGESPLPDGRVMLFRENAEGGLSFLAQQQIRYVPVKAEIEVNLGADDLVVYETRRTSIERLNFHFHWSDRQEFVDGWDEKSQWVDTIRNYRTKPIALELRRQWDGDVEYSSEVATTLFDYRTPETKFTVGPRGKLEYPAAVTVHMGVNAKQSRVRIVGVPKP